jgi:integrase
MASIRKDKQSGKWIVDYKRGSERRRIKFSSRQEALDYKRELILRREGYVAQEIQTPLQEAISSYIANVTSTKSKFSQDFEPVVLNDLCEYFEGKNVQELGLLELEKYQAALNKRLLGQTVNRRFNTIKHFFNKCIDWGYLKHSPAAKLKKLKATNLKAKKPLSREQMITLLRGAKPWLRDVLWFVVETGVRRAVAANLRWSAVDWTNNQIHLESSDGFENKDRKVHTLPMTEDLKTLLLDLHDKARRAFKAKPIDFVFLDDRAQKIRPDRLTHEAKKLLIKTLGVESGAVHILRHTSLTLRHREGVSIDNVRQIAGHANIRTTQIYLHADGEHLREEMSRTSPLPLPLVKAGSVAPNGTNSLASDLNKTDKMLES